MSVIIGDYCFWKTGDAPRILEVQFIRIPKDHSKKNKELTQYFGEDEIETFLVDHETTIYFSSLTEYYTDEGDYEQGFDMQKFQDYLLFLDRQAPELLTKMILHSKPTNNGIHRNICLEKGC